MHTQKKKIIAYTDISRKKKQKYYLCITSPKEFVKIYVPLWYINTCNKFYWYRCTHKYLYIIYIKQNEQSEKTFCGAKQEIYRPSIQIFTIKYSFICISM